MTCKTQDVVTGPEQYSKAAGDGGEQPVVAHHTFPEAAALPLPLATCTSLVLSHEQPATSSRGIHSVKPESHAVITINNEVKKPDILTFPQLLP